MRTRPCDCERCFYCGTWLPTRHEHDHVPVPRRNLLRVGKRWQPACLTCHDFKDRLLLEDWPVDLVGAALAAVGKRELHVALRGMLHSVGVGVDNRGRFADLDSVFCQAFADEAEAAIATTAFPGNLLLAKVISLAFWPFPAGKPAAHECTAR